MFMSEVPTGTLEVPDASPGDYSSCQSEAEKAQGLGKDLGSEAIITEPMGSHAAWVRHRHHAHFSAIQGPRLKVLGHVTAGPERLRPTTTTPSMRRC